MNHIQPYLLVAIGGATGACLRYSVTQAVGRLAGHGFPLGTMVVNVVGSFLMGLLVTWLAVKVDGGQGLRLTLATGFLGGFTTFSAFSADAQVLIARGLYGQAGFYMVGSVAISIAALLIGIWLGRTLWA